METFLAWVGGLGLIAVLGYLILCFIVLFTFDRW